MCLLKTDQNGMTLVELVIAASIMVLIFSGIATLFTHTAQHGWKGNSDRLNHIQDQVEINNLQQTVGKYINVATSVTFVSPEKLDLIINNPDSTGATPEPLDYSLIVVPHPENPAMKTINLVRNTSPTETKQLINTPFLIISFNTVASNSVPVTVQKSGSGQEQTLIITYGGYK